jgi:hypothetical protein
MSDEKSKSIRSPVRSDTGPVQPKTDEETLQAMENVIKKMRKDPSRKFKDLAGRKTEINNLFGLLYELNREDRKEL